MIEGADDVADAAVAATAAKITYGGAGASFLGALLSNQFVSAVGLITAVGGFIVLWIYRHRQDVRDRRVYELRIAKLMQGEDTHLDSSITHH